MSDSGLQSVFPAQAALGECPVWAGTESALYWVDIEAPSLNRFDPSSGTNAVYPMPENIGCFALRSQGGFIAGLRSGIWLLNELGQPVRCVARPVEDTSISRFNDGRADAWGRFWAGTIYEPRDKPLAGLYCIRADFECRQVAGGVLVSNGVAFSPDCNWVYHSDTPNHVVYRYPLNPENGEIVGPREVFHRFPFGYGRPDGAAIDSEGCYWSALFDGGRVVRLSPEGKILAEYSLPARCPTMCAFGGVDLKTLYVTTARHGRSDEELATYPESGNLFAMRTDVAGRPEPPFIG